MLRELVEISWLEDFIRGLAPSAGGRVCAYDARRTLLAATPAVHEFTRRTRHRPETLPANLSMVAVPADAPPRHIAFVEQGGVWQVIAPVYLDEHQAGFLGVGEFREQSLSGKQWQDAEQAAQTDLPTLIQLWEALPRLDRGGGAPAIGLVRWGARMLSEWCRREKQMQAATEEISLVGDIAELLTGEQDLQKVLERMVAETARVMQCRFCSLRLYNPVTKELTSKATYNLSERYLSKGAITRSSSVIDAEALRGKLVWVEDMATDPRVTFPDEARQEGIVSGLTAGMVYRGAPVGVLRVYTDRKQRFRSAQRNLLRAVAYQAATAIVHAQLAAERLRNAETERQLALAGELQARMVRASPPQSPALQTALVYSPWRHVGGDFCDFLVLPDGRLAGVVADVAGKGIPASLLMASARGALRALASSGQDLGAMLTRLNRQICGETSAAEFITLLMVAIDTERGRLTYCNAGHEPVLILRDGAVAATTEGGLVLGISADEVYEEHMVRIEPGDFVLLYTDGAVEAANFAGELFGRARLGESLRQHGGMHPEQCLRSIRWDIRRFVGLAEPADDMTLVGIRLQSPAQ